MSLASCPKCWEDLCECGEKYKHLSVERLQKLIDVLEDLVDSKSYWGFELLTDEGDMHHIQCPKCGTKFFACADGENMHVAKSQVLHPHCPHCNFAGCKCL